MARSTFPMSVQQNDFPTLGSINGSRTFLATPLRQKGELIGTLSARRMEVRPFTPAQIKLLETFADQAVIAHRERSAVQRTQGVIGPADSNERDPGRHRQLADGYSAGTGCGSRECRAAL